jgi:hypothetical protein
MDFSDSIAQIRKENGLAREEPGKNGDASPLLLNATNLTT